MGQTRATLACRLAIHMRRSAEKRTKCHCWIWSKTQQGIVIEIVELEVCELSELDSREKWWIAHLRLSGLDLLNMTPGGGGGPTRLGAVNSDEMRRKISVTKTGKKLSKAHVDAANAGRRRMNEVSLSCLSCKRSFESRAGFTSHYGAVHSGGNEKRAISIKLAWAEGRRVSPGRKPLPTVCGRGHTLDDSTLWISPTDPLCWRCRICHRNRARAYRAKLKEAAK